MSTISKIETTYLPAPTDRTVAKLRSALDRGETAARTTGGDDQIAILLRRMVEAIEDVRTEITQLRIRLDRHERDVHHAGEQRDTDISTAAALLELTDLVSRLADQRSRT